ncbi:MAG: hypothetical protein C0476_11075 [Sphingomonas sp.]|nr:hypothetical protein [Sphingomonas sp.]
MRFTLSTLGVLVLAATATPALADETDPPPAIVISGSATFTTDYRFRGVSRSDTDPAFQGGITISHKSGFYAGFWASNLSGWGTFGGPNLETDLIAGFKKPALGGTVDVGFTWYTYPGGANTTDFVEFYSKLSGTIGPATLTAGVFYAPEQRALGNFSNTPQSRFGDAEDNIYVSGDGAIAIPKTPITLNAHIGYSNGNPGLGPNGTSVTPTGSYWDYSIGASATYKNLTLSVSYVDTDISDARSAYLQPNFSRGQDGIGSIAAGTAVVSLTAAF